MENIEFMKAKCLLIMQIVVRHEGETADHQPFGVVWRGTSAIGKGRGKKDEALLVSITYD